MLKDELHLIISLPMERVFLLLEQGDFWRADNYCDQILDQDPRLAEAYVGKLLAELQIRLMEDLLTTNSPFTTSNNYQNALKFSRDPLKTFLATAPYENFYLRGRKIMLNARTEGAFKDAGDIFYKISNYKNSSYLYKKCIDSAQVCKKNAIYDRARNLLESNNLSECKEALRFFQTISGWKDADRQSEIASKKINKLTVEHQRKKRVIVFICSTIASIIAGYFLVTKLIIPDSHYNSAIRLMKTGDYEGAIISFAALGDYRDSAGKIVECKDLILERKYEVAKQAMTNGSYEAAIVMFEDLDGYRDSKRMIDSCRAAINDSIYSEAILLMNEGKYKEAIPVFEKLNGYLDSINMIIVCNKEIRYDEALNNINSKNYLDAYVILSALGSFKDSNDLRNSIWNDYKTSLKQAKIGSSIVWGSYEQDADTSNGKEPIEWYVISKNNNRILVLSKYILDRMVFDKYYSPYSLDQSYWESCSLRTWLNNDFFNNSFTHEERTMIPSTNVEVHTSPENTRKSFGNATTDKVFLLSTREFDQYLTGTMKRTEGTIYANKKGKYESWWLRNNAGYAWSIHAVLYGDIFSYFPNDSDTGVRPAMWINTN